MSIKQQCPLCGGILTKKVLDVVPGGVRTFFLSTASYAFPGSRVEPEPKQGIPVDVYTCMGCDHIELKVNKMLLNYLATE